MNRTTTIVLLLVLAAVSGLLLLLRKSDAGAPPAFTPPDRVLDFDAIDTVEVGCADGSRGMLRRSGPDWILVSDRVAGGREVRGDGRRVRELLEVARALSPLDSRGVEGADLAALGLLPVRREVVLRQGDGALRLAVGDADAQGDVWILAAGGGLHRVPRRIHDILSVPARAFRDPRLFGMDFAEVRAVRVLDAGGILRYRAERAQGSYVLTEPVVLTGDDGLLHELFAGLAALAVTEPAEDGIRASVVGRVTLEADGSGGRSAEILRPEDPGDPRALGRREGEPEMFVLDGAILPVVSRDPGDLRDRALVRAPVRDIERVEVTSPAGDFTLARTPTGKVRLVAPIEHDADADLANRFLEAILALRVEGYPPGGAGPDPAITLTVAVRGRSAAAEFRISPAAADGTRRVGKPDEPGSGLLRAGAADFLLASFRDLMERNMHEGAWFEIVELDIRDLRQKREAILRPAVVRVDGADRIRWSRGTQPIPQDFINPLLARLVPLVARDIVGLFSSPPPGTGLEDPVAVIRLGKAPVTSDPESSGTVTIARAVSEVTIRLGAVADGAHYAAISTVPGIVFTWPVAEVTPFLNMCR